MKFIRTFVALGLTLSLATAQTDSSSTNVVPSTPPPVVPVVPIHGVPLAPTTPLNAPETRGGKWEGRALNNIAKAKVQGDSIKLIFDGDSITDYWQKPDRGVSVWTDRYAKYHPFDFAIAGDTTQNLLWRLANGQAQGLHPKLIVLLIGTNDLKYICTPQEIADGVKQVIAEYQKACPDAVILLQAIFPRDHEPSGPHRQKIKDTNEILAKLADGTKVVFLDFGDKFLTPKGVMEQEIMADYLHPTTKGYQIWADAIQPVIDKYLPSK